MNNTKTYTFDVIDAGDGTGNVLLQLSDDFCHQEDWRIDDIIEWVVEEDGSFQLINKSKKGRE